jgi:hypothetical protein
MGSIYRLDVDLTYNNMIRPILSLVDPSRNRVESTAMVTIILDDDIRSILPKFQQQRYIAVRDKEEIKLALGRFQYHDIDNIKHWITIIGSEYLYYIIGRLAVVGGVGGLLQFALGHVVNVRHREFLELYRTARYDLKISIVDDINDVNTLKLGILLMSINKTPSRWIGMVAERIELLSPNDAVFLSQYTTTSELLRRGRIHALSWFGRYFSVKLIRYATRWKDYQPLECNEIHTRHIPELFSAMGCEEFITFVDDRFLFNSRVFKEVFPNQWYRLLLDIYSERSETNDSEHSVDDSDDDMEERSDSDNYLIVKQQILEELTRRAISNNGNLSHAIRFRELFELVHGKDNETQIIIDYLIRVELVWLIGHHNLSLIMRYIPILYQRYLFFEVMDYMCDLEEFDMIVARLDIKENDLRQERQRNQGLDGRESKRRKTTHVCFEKIRQEIYSRR